MGSDCELAAAVTIVVAIVFIARHLHWRAALLGLVGLGIVAFGSGVLFARAGRRRAGRRRAGRRRAGAAAQAVSMERGRSVKLLASKQARLEGWATPRDLRPLLLREVPGDRIVVGCLDRRRLVAAEQRQSVLVVGPSQSGKTSGLAVPAILEWHGPVLATSVKSDLVRATIDVRRTTGPVSVFDPSKTTWQVLKPGEAAGWSPLGAAATWIGARRVASALCDVAESDGGMEDAGFWYASAEKLLAPLLFAAATSGCSMGDVVAWIDEQEVGEVILALELAGVPDALRAARTSFAREDRQRSSVFATAETVVAAFADPNVAEALLHTSIDPAEFVASGRSSASLPGRALSRWPTLYCCAPAREQQRLRPVFTALVREVIDAAFTLAAAEGGPVEPGLLVVLDEAANVAPLAELDSILATAAGHGVEVMTVWQDFAQIESRYGRRWSTIVNNHRAKVVCPGVSDPFTLDHLQALVGEHERREVSTTVDADGRRSRTEVTARRALAPAGSIRQLPEGTAALLYGALPPAKLLLRPYVSSPRAASPGELCKVAASPPEA